LWGPDDHFDSVLTIASMVAIVAGAIVFAALIWWGGTGAKWEQKHAFGAFDPCGEN